MNRLLIAALAATPLGFAAPAIAQERVLTIFGNDRCPENTICVRAPETERYRIPKNLRQDPVISPERQSWAARAQSVTDAGAAQGPGSCTASGPNGWTGCFNRQMQAARADRQQTATQTTPDLDD